MSNEFILGIDAEKFRRTNFSWNKLMLNDPWSVGYVSTLIETREWTSKEDWENFYYKSGEQRKALLGSNANLLNDYTLQLRNKSVIYGLPWNVKNLNYQYGRTKDDLLAKAKTLGEEVQKFGLNLTTDELFECVRFRTICETWNGIILRENNTVKTIQNMFPSLTVKKTDGEVDHDYAVDYELYSGDKLVSAIQVKPKSYLGNAPYLRKACMANASKYAAYKELHNVDVVTVISKTNGEIINLAEFNQAIQTALHH